MADLSLNDGLLITATVLGPILAVQAQKFVERATEKRHRKVRIFETLMATRATRISPEHVQALNTIELVFNRGWYPRQKEKAVVAAWRTHLDNLNPLSREGADAASVNAWNERCFDSFVELMMAMSRALGYDFDSVQVKRGAYLPQGHFDTEVALREIQQGFAKVLSGQQAIAMNVVGFPIDQRAVDLQIKFNEQYLKALTGEGALYVATKDGKISAP
jgi:hypothetical protein